MHKLNNKINNPKVTLADESRAGVKELYSLGGSILSMHLEQMDLVSITIAKGKGGSRQLPNSIYKIGEFPGMLHEKMFRNPAGTLKIETREHSILVSCGPQYQVECFEDNSWHLLVDTMISRAEKQENIASI